MQAQRTPVSYSAELSALFGAGEELPFWLVSNRFGVIDPAGSSANFRFKASTGGAAGERLKYLVGADLVSRASQRSSVFFQQLFGQIQAGAFLFRAGRKEDSVGLVEHELSLGSMTLGTNATPITMISLSIPEYVGVPGMGDVVSFRGFLGHGWMTGSRVVQNAYLHEKYLNIRLGIESWGVYGHVGVTHFSQWGGTYADPEVGDLPARFNDYLRVFFVRPAKDNTKIFLENNALGNSVGAYDMRLDLVRPNFELSVYRQFYLEDTVSFRLRNKWDGLWGVFVRFSDDARIIRSVLWEHVNTKQQGSLPSERIGTDNYYNHGLYGSGWTHRGRSMGLPLMFTENGFEGVVNNILVAHHVGVAGRLADWIDYTFFATYSRNYGVHTLFQSEPLLRYETAIPFTRKDQYSLGLNLETDAFSRFGVAGILRLAYDWGEWLPDQNVGISIGIRKEGGF
jgi:hypothetical protein